VRSVALALRTSALSLVEVLIQVLNMWTRDLIRILAIAVFSCACAQAQDSQSLGDAARQARQQKQSRGNSATTSTDPKNSNAAKPPHVVTNDEIPEQESPVSAAAPSSAPDSVMPDYSSGKHPAEYWKSQILRVKNAIASLQRSIDTLSNSIRFAGGNYEKHVAWNERQREKQRQLEIMKSQLNDSQKRLEEMQETARKQGYGSSVYDP
jgi:hypothetical protein